MCGWQLHYFVLNVFYEYVEQWVRNVVSDLIENYAIRDDVFVSSKVKLNEKVEFPPSNTGAGTRSVLTKICLDVILTGKVPLHDVGTML